MKKYLNNKPKLMHCSTQIGSAIISEDNTSKYMLIQYSDNALTAPDDLVKSVGLHFLNKNRRAYEKLAK